MSTIAPERRVYADAVQVRDLETTDSLSRLSGIAVPYNHQTDVGFYLESFEAGALSKSIAEAARGLPLLLFHDDRSFPIGIAEEWQEKSDGLHGVWRLDSGEIAQRAAQLAKDNLLAYMSIRFVPIRSEWTYVEDFAPDLGAAHKDAVVRKEARLLETSLVSTPAYAGAQVKWVRTGETQRRTAGPTELDGWKKYLNEARGETR
jgi:HK97 family phage prohead protease